MPRVVKHPDVRRGELLDCAQALFFARGYDNVSLNQVIAEAGVSKGAFYHYFESKEALLEALAERHVQAVVAQADRITDDAGLDALARLNAVLARARARKIETVDETWRLFEALFRPENLLLYHRIRAAMAPVAKRMLAGIVAQGAREGTFDAPDAEGAAELIYLLGAIHRESVGSVFAATTGAAEKAALAALERSLRLQGIAIDRILGLPDGSVRFVEPGFVTAVFAARSRARSPRRRGAPRSRR